MADDNWSVKAGQSMEFHEQVVVLNKSKWNKGTEGTGMKLGGEGLQ